MLRDTQGSYGDVSPIAYCYFTFNVRYCMHTLQWRHNEHDCVSNHQPQDCLLRRWFRRRSKKTSKLRVTGLCEDNSPVTGEFPAQRASNAEDVSIWWRHHDLKVAKSQEIRWIAFQIQMLQSLIHTINHLCWILSEICAEYGSHDDLIKLKHFPRYWPFVWGIHWSPVNSPHKGQWRGALMFSLICA